jgi:tetratricopeptide (TPR) repeat protein
MKSQILCLFVCLAAYQAIFGQKDILSPDARAQTYVGNFEPCIAEMSKLVKLQPRNDPAFVERARCLFLSSDDTNDFRKILAEKSKTISDKSKAENATDDEMFSRKDRAIADATKAIALNPKNAEAYNIRGLVKSTRTMEERAESIGDYDKAIAINPKFIKPYFNRAIRKIDLKDDEGAIADLAKVIEIDPKNTNAVELRSSLLLEQEARTQAREKCFKSAYPFYCVPTFKEYADAHPNSAKAFLDLARVNNSVEAFHSLENRESYWRNAEATYLKAIEIDANSFAAYSELSDLYVRKLGEPNKAIAVANNSIKAMPNNAEAYVLRGNNLLIPGDTKNALNDFNRAIELDPKSSSAYVGRGDAYFLAKDYAKAMSDYNQGIQIDPANGQAFLQRGIMLASQKKFTDAISDLNAAENLKTTCAKSYRGYTYALTALENKEPRDTGNFRKAQRDFLDDDSLKCYLTDYFYAQVLFAQAFNKEALERIEYAIKRFQKTSEATFNEALKAKEILALLRAEKTVSNSSNSIGSPNSANSSGNLGKTITQILEEYKRDLPSEGLRLVASGIYNYSGIADPKMRFAVERVGFGRNETYVFIGIKADGAEFGFDVIYDDRFIAKPTGTTLKEKAEYGFNTKIKNEGKFSIYETNFYLPNSTAIRGFQISPRGGGTSDVHWLVFKK